MGEAARVHGGNVGCGMKIRLPDINLRDMLRLMREYESDDTLAVELVAYVWESMPEKATQAMMQYLMRAHEENGEPWPAVLADLVDK